MIRSPFNATRLRSVGAGIYFRPRDAKRAGLTFAVLQRSVRSGSVTRISPGLYRLAAAAPDEFESIAMAAALVPRGVICLLSALRLHGIGTQAPHQVWIALDRKARQPAQLRTQARFVRASGTLLTEGVETRRLLGVAVRVTSPARTVVDCFRYRNKIGLDVALEALRDALRTRRTTPDELDRVATRCRARTVLRTYLQAVVS